MGGGALEPKTVVGVSKEAFYKKKKNAFTLAEVLITLAIIGVVAALTIPTVVAKYQKKAYYTAFMKSYNTIENVFAQAQAENGSFLSWGLPGCANCDTAKEAFNSKILPYFKATKVCYSNEECGFSGDITINILNGDPGYDEYTHEKNVIKYNSRGLADTEEPIAVFLNDGSLFVFSIEGEYILVGIDTNGMKGPNTYGRDIFPVLSWDSNTSDNKTGMLKFNFWDSEEEKPEEECSTTGEVSEGWTCAYRLLSEGAMNY